MLFEEYYKIMKEHGIGEFFFLYNGKECSILMDVVDFSLNYSISFGEEFYSSNDFDEIVAFKFLSIEKTLEEIYGVKINKDQITTLISAVNEETEK